MGQHLLQALRDEKQAAGRAALKAIKLAESYSRKLEEEYAIVLSKLGMVSFMSSQIQCNCQCMQPMQCCLLALALTCRSAPLPIKLSP